MLENDFKNKCGRLFDGHWQPIETSTIVGCPDVIATKDGKSCWLEFKVNKGGGVLLRPEQRAWILRYRKRGGGLARVICFNYKDKTVSIYDDVMPVERKRVYYKNYLRLLSEPVVTDYYENLRELLGKIYD